jgi:CheY-like chemotaxis protein
MKEVKASILIVEDEESVRNSLAEVFKCLGYRTRSAADGIAALMQIRQEVPDILLSDLNMPVMSGFELLSIVHRRFPAIYVVAMSGMFTEDPIPSGVTADSFYQKGSGVRELLKVVETRLVPRREHRGMPEPIWVQRNGHDASGREFVMIACPECFRTFPQPISGKASLILDTSCAFCHSWILYAVVDPNIRAFPPPWQPTSKEARPIAPLHWSPAEPPRENHNAG